MRAKQRIIDIISSNPELSRMLKSISPAWHDEKKGYPQVTVTQIISRPAFLADNHAVYNGVVVQVDIWSKGDPFEVSGLITKALNSEGIFAVTESEKNEENINRIILEIKLQEETGGSYG